MDDGRTGVSMGGTTCGFLGDLRLDPLTSILDTGTFFQQK